MSATTSKRASAWDAFWSAARQERPTEYLNGQIPCPNCGSSVSMHQPLEQDFCARHYDERAEHEPLTWDQCRAAVGQRLQGATLAEGITYTELGRRIGQPSP